jgi:hypothetical protein
MLPGGRMVHLSRSLKDMLADAGGSASNSEFDIMRVERRTPHRI